MPWWPEAMPDPSAMRRAFTGPGFEDGEMRATIDRSAIEQAWRQFAANNPIDDPFWKNPPYVGGRPPANARGEGESAGFGWGPMWDIFHPSSDLLFHKAGAYLQRIPIDEIDIPIGDGARPHDTPFSSHPCIGFQSIEPPPYDYHIHPITRGCFEDQFPGLTTWPDTPCAAPCTQVRYDPSCDHFPSSSEKAFISSIVPIRPLPAYACAQRSMIELTSSNENPNFVDFVHAAVALLFANIDLMEWSACQPTYWSWKFEPPNGPITSESPHAGGFGYSRTDYLDCVMSLFSGSKTIYLIENFPPQTDPSRAPTGGTTKKNDLRPWDHPGVVIPQHPWLNRLRKFRQGGEVGMCAMTDLAGTILHELLHLCDPGPLERDPSVQDDNLQPHVAFDCHADDLQDFLVGETCCWNIQNMAANNLTYALAERFPCMAGTCQRTDRFAGSHYYKGHARTATHDLSTSRPP